MELIGSCEKVSGVSKHQREEMFRLLNECFRNVQRQTFLQDLTEKDEVFLLAAPSGRLCGFSTMQLFHHSHEGVHYRVIFSGDTVISPKHWGSLELPVLWGTRMMQHWERDPMVPLLWMLISKGIRTYKFLPAFFKRYYPASNGPPPDGVCSLADSLGKKKFPLQYNPQSGLIEPVRESYFLKPELAAVPKSNSRRPYIEYFCRKNPAFAAGAELLCLCEFSPENLRPFIRRQIESRRREEEAKRNAA